MNKVNRDQSKGKVSTMRICISTKVNNGQFFNTLSHKKGSKSMTRPSSTIIFVRSGPYSTMALTCLAAALMLVNLRGAFPMKNAELTARIIKQKIDRIMV